MGIRVEHSPSPLTVGYAAMYAGQGQRAERDLDRRQRESMQVRQIAAAKAAQDSQQAFSEKMAALEFQQRKEMSDIGFEQNLTKDLVDFEQQMEFSYGDRAIQAKKTITEQEFAYRQALQTHELTEKEKIENGRIQERIGWVEDQVRNGTWTDEEGAQAIAQLQGIRKPPKIPKVTIQDELKDSVYQDPATGGWWVRSGEGLKYQMPPKGDTIGDYAKMFETATKALTKIGEDGSEVPPKFEDIQGYVQDIIRLKNAVSGGQPNGAPHDAQAKQPPTKIAPEQAQVAEQAVMQAVAQGITDPAELRAIAQRAALGDQAMSLPRMAAAPAVPEGPPLSEEHF